MSTAPRTNSVNGAALSVCEGSALLQPRQSPCGTKRCTGCRKELPRTAFRTLSNGWLSGRCVPCLRIYQTQWKKSRRVATVPAEAMEDDGTANELFRAWGPISRAVAGCYLRVDPLRAAL